MSVSFNKRLAAASWLLLVTLSVFALRPKWVGNTPVPLNGTYKFVEIVSRGSSLESARLQAKGMLEDDTQLQEGVRVYRKTKENTTIDKVRSQNSRLQERKSQHIEIETVVDGETYSLQAVRIDDWVEGREHGEYVLHTLFMVALCDDPVFDRTYLTTSYGAAPVFMSIIPGVGQWYKGSKVKGASMLASEAVAVAGIILCDNQRASYNKKAIEQPKFAKQYSSKASNWETGRNICIGVAAGLWVYNIVDAAVAKGCRRVIVKRADGGGLSLAPFGHPQGAGLSLAYRF